MSYLFALFFWRSRLEFTSAPPTIPMKLLFTIAVPGVRCVRCRCNAPRDARRL